MATITQARLAVRARIEAGNVFDGFSQPVPLRWQNEGADSIGNVAMPDTPAPFVYTEFLTNRATIVGFGAGPGANLHRTPVTIASYVFVPKDRGLDEAESI